ncbi:bis5'-nucleosyl-tetraphosphatase, putative [Theileria equi strain WA]|uniref:Bis(5'-nucleosyl)-tetraphosphatase [asymmetrical] n=1 Tax=Theileria equi strain WA TaxID=1537102 RepID=L0B1Z9_THEEQ|nr:bis5'-nucleosyl-tetraphosphatase, putative [Theileria equi strain WA]AFZ81159.1 bis5'-nucleosyl-tetraphosphatase, putative [Theileria equi strain WA]|eukprot:XP_004830825.1 bis5'-nucleosyl-tetraphosphatase, putative [Theileria equi strain WA]
MASESLVKASGFIIYRKLADLPVQFLLLKASNKPFHWTPPKGRLDPGEDFLDAAHRETREESGLLESSYDVDGTFKEVLHYEAHGAKKEVLYYLAKLKGEDAPIQLSEEHTEFAWVKLEDIDKYCDKESLISMFKHASEHIDKL